MTDSRPAGDSSRISVAALLLALPASFLLLPGCISTRTTTAAGFVADKPPKGPNIPAPGETQRVGGDLDAVATKDGDNYSIGKHLINTPLPKGYPAPTPPGAIDLKMYPSVRRAEVSGKMMPDLSMNVAFFPLFNHIKRRNIEMTSPVEMDYRDLKVQPKDLRDAMSGTASGPNSGTNSGTASGNDGTTTNNSKPVAASPDASTPSTPSAAPDASAQANEPADEKRGWTMSFLYRTAELGPTGDDGKDSRVTVVDTPPVLMISKGFAGSYSKTRVKQVLAELESWLAEHPEWEPAGPARALFYNGPDTPVKYQWAEAQIPVKARAR